MRSLNRSTLVLFGGIGIALVLSGCPKKVETTQQGATVEEGKATPSAEAVKPEPAPPPNVEETPAAKEAEMPSQGLVDAFFDFDRYTIREVARTALENDAQWLKGHPNARVKIEGHCDERGTNEYNLALGERRTKAVQRSLVALGVEKNRLSIISYGEERPACAERNETCYQNNRRAHFSVQP